MLRDAAINELKAIYHVLHSDMAAAREIVLNSDTQFARRMLVRAFFAFVEGLAYSMRQVTLASSQEVSVFSRAELFLLREKKYQIDERGKVLRERDNYLPTSAGFLFSLRMYPKLHGAEFNPELGAGWEAFKSAQITRDAITHPKSLGKLEISDAAFLTFVKASDWGQATLAAMFAACEEADRKWSELNA